MANAATPLTGAELVPLVQNGLNVKVAAGLIGAINNLQYQGTWNASTNTPTITSSVGTTGYYYIVSVAGTTTINGISTWNVGDWIIFSNTGVWQRISGGTISSLQIVSDTSSNTNYNIALTNVTSGLINTEYVDPTDLSFNPSTKTLTATNVKVNNTLTANNANITNLTATNGNITNLTSSNATITGGTLSNVTLTNATGGAMTIVNDTNSGTTYNLLMTTSSGGNITSEYVDNAELTFTTGHGHDGPGLSAPSTRINGYFTISDTPTSINYFAFENYASINGGTLTMYTPGDTGSLSIEPVAWNKYGWLGIGIDGPYDVWAPLMVSNINGGSSYQIFVTDDPTQNVNGLKIGYASGTTTLSSSGGFVINAAAPVTAAYFKTTPVAYASLPSAATAGAGARGFITDCTTTTFLATAAGGGTNKVPVVSNGTSWLVG